MDTRLIDEIAGRDEDDFEHRLKISEVAQIMRVDPRTVRNWAITGKLHCEWTMGGHRRFRESVVRAAMRGDREMARTGVPQKGAADGEGA